MRCVQSARLQAASAQCASTMPSVHGVLAQRQRPKGHGQNSTIKNFMSPPVRQSSCNVRNVHRTQSTPAYTIRMHQDFKSNDSVHSISASGCMNTCNTNLSSCSPADVRARALEAGAFFPLLAASCCS